MSLSIRLQYNTGDYQEAAWGWLWGSLVGGVAHVLTPEETASLLCAPTWPTVPARNPFNFPITIYYTTSSTRTVTYQHFLLSPS